MILNRNSWHYRVLSPTTKFNLGDPRYNLTVCKYFWIVVGRLLGILLASSFWVFCGFCMALFLWGLTGLSDYGQVLQTMSEFGLIIFALSTFVFVVCVIVATIVHLKDEGVGENSLFFSWIRDKKNKHCTVVRFED